MAVDYTQMTDPTTGKPFASQEAGQAWSNAMSGQSAAAGADSGVKASDASLAGTGAGLDWAHTGWNIDLNHDQTGASSQWFMAPDNTYGFQMGNNAGYLDPATGLITYGTKQANNTTGGGGNDATLAAAGRQTYTYAPTTDYGLGSGGLGVIPIEHNGTGQVSVFLAPAPGGGFQRFTTLEAAQASVAAYNTWKASTPGTPGGFGTSTNPANTPPAAAAGTTATGSTAPGSLTTPGAGEKYYDSTASFYGQPTNAQKQFDLYGSQPTAGQQTWNGMAGQFNTPSNAESLYGNYASTFADPHYLDDFYGRQQQAGQVALERRAASAGVGDSAAAAKATANLGTLYADRKLAGMEQFAQTGMGLAQGADAGKIGRAGAMSGLASGADTSVINRINAASGVDTGNLALVAGGQNAANSAENLDITRTNAGITTATGIGNDIATMTAAGMEQATASQLATNLSALDVQYKSGALSAQQAYQQATEMASLAGVIGNAAVMGMIASKYGGSGSSGNSGPVTGPLPGTGK